MLVMMLVAALSCSSPEIMTQVENFSREYNKGQVDILFPPKIRREQNVAAKQEVDRAVYKWKDIQEVSPGVCSAVYNVDTINLLTGEPMVGEATVVYSLSQTEGIEFIGEK